MVDFRLKGAGGKATAKRFRTSAIYQSINNHPKITDTVNVAKILEPKKLL